MSRIANNRTRLVLVLLTTAFLAPSHFPASSPPCSAAVTGSWVANLAERMLSFDLLGLFAVERFGKPTACGGEVTAEFDGMEFGQLRFEFAGGEQLQLDTFPPESSRVELSVPSGFPAESEPRERLREYTEKIGVEIDWSTPEVTRNGAVTVETFRAPDTGLNGSAQVESIDGKITVLRFAMAL